MKGKETSESVKAQVIAALLSGQGVNEIARNYNLPKATVSRLKNTLTSDQLEQVGTEKKERIGELIAGYLTTALTTLQVQAVHARDKAWLEKQSAENLAVLHGVIADKSIRILEAIEPADEAGFVDSESQRETQRVH
jgi:DNA-binding IclR family transcriptional regulator